MFYRKCYNSIFVFYFYFFVKVTNQKLIKTKGQIFDWKSMWFYTDCQILIIFAHSRSLCWNAKNCCARLLTLWFPMLRFPIDVRKKCLLTYKRLLNRKKWGLNGIWTEIQVFARENTALWYILMNIYVANYNINVWDLNFVIHIPKVLVKWIHHRLWKLYIILHLIAEISHFMKYY